jgi:hypothetical protein
LALAVDTQSEIVLGSQDLSNNYVDAAKVRGLLKANKTDGELSFYTLGSSTLTQRLNINSGGDISFYDDSGNAKLIWDASAESLGIGVAAPEVTAHVSNAVAAGSDNLALRIQNPTNAADARVGIGFHVNAVTGAGWDGAYIQSANTGSDSGDLRFGSVTNNTLTEQLRIGSTGIIYVNGDGTGGRISGDGSGALVLQDGNGRQSFKILSPASGSTQAMTLDASSNLLVGKTSSAFNTAGVQLQSNGELYATRDGGTVVSINRKSSDGAVVNFAKDGTTVGSIGTRGGDLTIGTGNCGLIFNDGTEIIIPANITTNAVSDAAVDLGYSAGRFKDIWLSGKIAKGTGGELDLRSDGGGFNYKQNLDVATAGCTFTGQSTRGDVAAIRLYQTATGADGGYIRLDTCNAGSTTPTEKARIDASGSLLVGGTAYPDGTDTNWGVNAGGVQASSRTTTSTAIHYTFYNTNGAVGTITTNGSATAYNTSSDQRLKENIVDAPSASSDIDAIQVRSFDWKADGSHQKYGMVAQELQTVAPEAVSAPEDPEEMMGVDYSKLVPMLVKEIQSLRARVAQLES